MNNKTEMSSTQQKQEQQGLPLLNNGEIDYESIRLEMSESKTGSKNGSLTSDGKKFSFQVDGSTVYSASRYPRDGEGPNISYSITIEFDDESAKQIEAFEERIKNIIFDNHKAVFGKSYSKDQKSVVSALCNGLLNDKRQLRFNIQTPYKSKNFSVVVAENDESETVSTFEELEKRIQRNMLVSVIGYVRFYFDRNGKFANSFVCEAIKIRGEGEKKEYKKKDDVIPIEDLDVSSLKASKPAKNEGGKLKSKVSLNGSEWFKVKLTNLYGKFGISTGMASDGQEGGNKYSIHSSFSNEHPIYQKLKEIDAFSVEHGTFYSEEIFGKKFGPKLIEGKYKKCLNEKLGASGDGEEVMYISTNLSLYTMDGKPNIKVIDSKTGNEISVGTFDELSECFPEGTYFDAIVRLNFSYYSTTVSKNSTVSTPTNFGLKMYVKELHIVPSTIEKKTFVFRSGSEEDSAPTPASAPLTRTASASAPSKAVVASRNSDEEEESGDEVVSRPEPKSSKKETVLDSDEDEEEESEEETPAPAPAPPAKTVRKGADPLPSMPTPVKKVVSSRK
jgi:hypothetical protein